jgi:hypothetical protein
MQTVQARRSLRARLCIALIPDWPRLGLPAELPLDERSDKGYFDNTVVLKKA